jgi:hypothetical protein
MSSNRPLPVKGQSSMALRRSSIKSAFDIGADLHPSRGSVRPAIQFSRSHGADSQTAMLKGWGSWGFTTCVYSMSLSMRKPKVNEGDRRLPHIQSPTVETILVGGDCHDDLPIPGGCLVADDRCHRGRQASNRRARPSRPEESAAQIYVLGQLDHGGLALLVLFIFRRAIRPASPPAATNPRLRETRIASTVLEMRADYAAIEFHRAPTGTTGRAPRPSTPGPSLRTRIRGRLHRGP